MIEKLLKIGDSLKLKEFRTTVSQINSIEGEFNAMSDAEIGEQKNKFKKRYESGESLEIILPEAFAVVREAARRSINQRHFDVQLMAGIALHEGAIAEVKTGEGKTLISTLPAYLNSIAGRVHIATVNTYLAERDEKWMRNIYMRLNVETGVISPESSHEAKKAAYTKDIVYGVNTEFGFDYLRDNMALNSAQRLVNYDRHFIILDEVDLTLIDNARTPLIISQPMQPPGELYRIATDIAEKLTAEVSYTVNFKHKSVHLTEVGITEIEQMLKIDSLYSIEEGSRYIYYVMNALYAKEIYKPDRDYIVYNNTIVIIDEYTGRMLHGRRYQEGIHQAIESKHSLEIKEESSILSSVTIQNFVKLYKKFSGMTGTAMSEAREFQETYKLPVYQIPTNKRVIRSDHYDMVFITEEAKYRHILETIIEKHRTGQPILVGTPSIVKSEHLSSLLKRANIKHKVLNAKNHAEEAEIIANAGRLNSVIISTNMAGRGTDITLGGNVMHIANKNLRNKYGDVDLMSKEEYSKALYNELEIASHSIEQEQKKIKELNGLCVIGCERHEARRIDNQLRGRSGRQGDPGESIFYVSLEDTLLKNFHNDTIVKFFTSNKALDENINIKSKLLNRAIESAQLSIEHYNSEIRKNLYKYDNVLNKHRKSFYSLRNKILDMEQLKDKAFFQQIISSYITSLVDTCISSERRISKKMLNMLDSTLKKTLEISVDRNSLDEIGAKHLNRKDRTQHYIELKAYIMDLVLNRYKESLSNFSEEAVYQILKQILLNSADFLWRTHLQIMNDIQSSISLRAIGQKDPIVEYKKEGNLLYKELLEEIKKAFTYQSINIQGYDIDSNGMISLFITENQSIMH